MTVPKAGVSRAPSTLPHVAIAGVGKIYEFTARGRGGPQGHQRRPCERGVCQPARPQRLRQEHAAQDRRRPRPGQCWRGENQRRERWQAFPTAWAWCFSGMSCLIGARSSTTFCSRLNSGSQAPRLRKACPRPLAAFWPGRLRTSLPVGAFRRHAPARRDLPGVAYRARASPHG